MKRSLSSQAWNSLDPALQALYEKKGDSYTLSLDDEDDIDDPKNAKSKVEEFRRNNIKLMEEKKALEAKQKALEDQLKNFDGVDMDEYKKAKEILNKMDNQQDADLIKAGKIDEVLSKRTESMRKTYEAQVQKMQQQLGTLSETQKSLQSKLHAKTLTEQVSRAVSEVGNVRQGAMLDIVNRARETFEYDPENDTLVAPNKFDTKGSPLSVEAWAQSLLQSATYLFEPGQGAGGKGGGTSKPQKGVKTISNDPILMGRYADQIAKGEVVVVSESND